AVELQRERVEMVVDRVAGVLERQTGRVRSAPGVVVAQHERVRRQIPLRVQVVPPERQRVARVRVPIQFYDELVIVGVVEVPLVRSEERRVGKEGKSVWCQTALNTIKRIQASAVLD